MPILVPASTSVSLNELKQHLNMSLSKTTHDEELRRFLAAAETAISHVTGPLTPTPTVEKHHGGAATIILRHPRAVALTSLAYSDGTTTSLDDFDLDTETGIVHWGCGTAGSFPSGVRNVTVSYTAGFSEIPTDLKHAVKELVRHLWETQRGAVTRPGFTDSEDSAVLAGAFSSLPERVQQLIQPYAIPTVA